MANSVLIIGAYQSERNEITGLLEELDFTQSLLSIPMETIRVIIKLIVENPQDFIRIPTSEYLQNENPDYTILNAMNYKRGVIVALEVRGTTKDRAGDKISALVDNIVATDGMYYASGKSFEIQIHSGTPNDLAGKLRLYIEEMKPPRVSTQLIICEDQIRMELERDLKEFIEWLPTAYKANVEETTPEYEARLKWLIVELAGLISERFTPII